MTQKKRHSMEDIMNGIDTLQILKRRISPEEYNGIDALLMSPDPENEYLALTIIKELAVKHNINFTL